MLTHLAHCYSTRYVSKKKHEPSVKTTKYGLKSITYKAVTAWNNLISKNIISEDLKRNE